MTTDTLTHLNPLSIGQTKTEPPPSGVRSMVACGSEASVDAPIAILEEDHDLMFVNKPAGLLSVPGKGLVNQDCLIHRIHRTHPNALIVHRLDQATSGLMVLAKNPGMHRKLGWLFEHRQVDKRYEAWVIGRLQGEGCINLPLKTDWPNRPRQMVCHDTGKPSITHWQALQHDPHRCITRLVLTPQTGRTHQLRVHLLSIGHPIVGDTLYHQAPAGRLMLHACRLGFVHPLSGKRVELHCPTPF